MEIAVCGSMVFSPEMVNVKDRLQDLGCKVVLPDFTEQYAKLNSKDKMREESLKNKSYEDSIRNYYHKIKFFSDTLLVYNETRKGIESYIGGNTFLEMGFAHVLGKKIFLYYSIPDIDYRDEIEAMHPQTLNGDLNAIFSKK